MTTLPIDAGGHHVVHVAAGRARLAHDAGDRRSPVHEALLRHLRVVIAGRDHRFDEHDGAPWAEAASLTLGGLLLRDGARDGAYLLSPIECRFLADNGAPHPAFVEAAQVTTTPTTDLHTHLAACVRGADLARLGAAHGVSYPGALLAELGIRAEGDRVELATLPDRTLDLLGARLAVPHDRQITFLEMERLYRWRSPLTKHPELLVPQLQRLAEDYAAAGVRYVELSFSDIIRKDTLVAIHREVPPIEARTGVRLRFLAALSRHDDLEWDLDVIDRLEALAASPYLVGVDFMGHETNATQAFGVQLTELARRMGMARPGFVVRVHAGENPAFPANVREALELVRGHDVRLRIGHGLYGVDDATLAALREAGVIVEFNLTSNFSLNNVQSLGEVPLQRYLRAGVPVVLGTDGPGLHGTDAGFEARAARLSGLSAEELQAIRQTEDAYVAGRLELDGRCDPAMVVPDDPTGGRHGPEVEARKRQARARRDAALVEALDALGVAAVDDLERALSGRRCISIAGSWRHAWASTPEATRVAVRAELGVLLDGLRGAVLLTGGTRWGVEHEVQQLAAERGIDVVALLVKETPPEAISPDVRRAAILADNLYMKAAALYELARERDAACLFVGGGPIVNDEIQTASNLRLDVLLMDGPPGASSSHARERPERAFRTGAEALAMLAALERRPAPFWHLGANPTADVVLLRRDGEAVRVLLIRRDLDAPSEGGKWALPGGFVATDAPRGEAWRPGRESTLDAALRELREETGLDLADQGAALALLGSYEGGGRDSRDRASAWSRTTVFAGWLPDVLRGAPLAGGDDASDAQWVDVRSRPALAFDHERILQDALRMLGVR
jgi:ADP-ribose pyrophosphatase YjhB (NUDIX family)/adenosine deaminase